MTETVGYRRNRDFVLFNTVGICAFTREQLVTAIFSLPTVPVSATVALVGIPAVIGAIENAELAALYNTATIAAIDGMPIVKLARKSGYQVERCSAPDFMGQLLRESIRRGKTHYFYGGKDETVLAKLRSNLERDYKGINIAGMYAPPFRPLSDEEEEALCGEINRLKPDFLWVGIGAPKQERWMADHRQKLGPCVLLGVGAGFDYLAGTLDKAPPWMERWCIEWLYRLAKEPRRLWRRYVLGGVKLLYYSLVLGDKLKPVPAPEAEG